MATEEFPFYTSDQAAEFLGVHVRTLRMWCRNGTIPYAGKAGKVYLFSRENLETFRRKYLSNGMSHQEIARKYGKDRTTVIYYFKERLKVRPIGIDRRKKNAACYDPETVAKFAKILKWEPVIPQDRTDE